MKHIFILAVLFLSAPSLLAQALEVETLAAKTKNYCYSAYHLQQQLNHSVTFGGDAQQQKTNVDIDFHVKEITPPNKNDLSTYKSEGKEVNIRSFIAYIIPNNSKVNGVDMDMSQHYLHPFLVLVDGDTGGLIDLKSTAKESSMLKEYMAFFDLFQYSEKTGNYRYRNGNGRYQASMSKVKNKPHQLIKNNTGYLKATDKKNDVQQAQRSYLSITLANVRTECFYQNGNGAEVFKTMLSTKAFVEGNAKFTIEADLNRALPQDHFFYTLTSDLTTWPGFDSVKKITRKEAFEKLSILMPKLSSLIQDDSAFIKTLLADKDTWSYLAEYALENGLSDELGIQLIWALNKTNTTESVTALTNLATSPLSNKNQIRAALALGSTSAPFTEESVEALKNHMNSFASLGSAQSNELTFVRMLGAMASRRSDTDPLQSNDIKQFLYSQTGSFDNSVNAAVIDAIGNLKNSIDSQGEDILLQGLSEPSDNVRQSVASAFKRIPYNSENSEALINQIGNETNTEVKNTLVEALGKSDNNNLMVKRKLLSLLDNERNSVTQKKSLSSLKKIDYDLQPEDMSLLSSSLKQETNIENQKLLAALILKQRRKQKN
ncbi:hypothetical protein MNBD_GAMMA06-237 [hydrothermal vent metagenome]|uniref:Uncharacterized protein n=1 Tax=hydrothermal vent metagenome TaxID=652676 RepID=A0A3B0XC50_9ZZZZ